eukprot:8473781-Pyramimonas_sp.AAC.1
MMLNHNDAIAWHEYAFHVSHADRVFPGSPNQDRKRKLLILLLFRVMREVFAPWGVVEKGPMLAPNMRWQPARNPTI